MREKREELEAVIEAELNERFPDVELVDFEVRGRPPILTLFIDKQGGVDLDLCASVAQSLEQLARDVRAGGVVAWSRPATCASRRTSPPSWVAKSQCR